MTIKVVYKDGTHRIIPDVTGVQKLVTDGYYMFTRYPGEPHLEAISNVAEILQTQDLQFL